MSPRRRLIIFLTIAVGLVLLLVLLFGIGSDKKKTEQPATKATPTVLSDYIERDSRMVLTIDGKINGDDIHRSIRISINKNDRELEVIQGYQNNVIQRNTFVNNINAYDTFVRALQRTNFGKVRNTKQTDERGVCPNGQRYTYEVIDNNENVSRTWSATCTRGTSLATSTQVLPLFQSQITDYFKLTNNVNLAAN